MDHLQNKCCPADPSWVRSLEFRRFSPTTLVFWIILAFLLSLSILCRSSLAQDDAAGYTLNRVFSPLTFNRPVLLLQAPDDPARWYVVEQPGTVRTFRNGDAAAGLFANLVSRILSGGERGLLGMAFHPDYPSTPEVFLSYTAAGDGRSVISRFIVNPGGLTLDPDSEEILLQQAQPFANHNGGHLAFGPDDGFLYIGLGDGGSAGDPDDHAQDTSTLLGALLRIDVDGGVPYAIPPDNPFAGSADCSTGCPEIYAWGLRNPWRFSFDTGSLPSELWLGDVGQNAWEEVNRIERGGNYGWRCFEGNHPFNQVDCGVGGGAPYLSPVVEYPHSDGNCSVTGGYVYRGSLLPELVGRYIFGDFCTGRVWAVVGDGSTRLFELLSATGRRIMSFAQDRDGEVYLLDLAGGIYQLQHHSPGRGLPWLMLLLNK